MENDWISPCFTGWLTSAAAAAQGAEPLPASLENRPLFTPFMTTAPRPPPTMGFNPNACEKMLLSTTGK